MLAFPAAQEARAADEEKPGPAETEGARAEIHNLEAGIAADRDKIIAEGRAIKEDRRKIKDAERLSDKTKAAQIKEEAGADIKKRETAIKELKTSISVKKDQRGGLLYGKGQKIETRTEGR